MNKKIINDNNSMENDVSDQIRKYMYLLSENKYILITLIIVGFLTTYFFSKNLKNVYESKVTIRVDKPQGNVLDEIRMPELVSQGNYLSNQMAFIKSFMVRNMAAQRLLDTIKAEKNFSNYSTLLKISPQKDTAFLNEIGIRELLLNLPKISTPKGIDQIEISVRGNQYKENQLIAITLANAYIEYNLDISRAQLTSIRKLLEEEKKKRFEELSVAEASLEDYEKKTGIINIEQNVANLIDNSAQMEALKNENEIDLRVAESNLNEIKRQQEKVDANISNYITSKLNEPYLQKLLSEIADIEVQKQLAVSNVNNSKVVSEIEKEADAKIATLKRDYDSQVQILKNGITSMTPDVASDIAKQLLTAELALSSLRNKNNAISRISRGYESKFSELPSAVIEYAKLERNKTAAEKLYTTLEEKYQEALINERSRLGNASIIDPGTDNYGPIGPDRPRLVIIGTMVGLTLGLLFVFGREKLDRTIKTPEDLENKGVSILCWIPNIEGIDIENSPSHEFLMGEKSKSNISEAFKALRTRIQFAKLEEKPLKSILITSSIPSEGKTTVAVNLGGSFALTGKKTLLLDCDLRKPRIHSIFNMERYPGLSDYLFSNCSLEEITRPTELNNMNVISAGTIPPNPSEILGSSQMKKFMQKMEEIYDVIIVDSPPFLSVTDAEILYNITDGSILIAQSNKTIKQAFFGAYQRMTSMNKHNLLGVILNNFNYKSSYAYYYNYYYYYYGNNNKADKKETKS